ncbi:molybdenum cofactor guanylyltransferase [Persicitalea sp.]|uniref:molybdenum cofactor guanylyltransferase n=1 Tax=Persicitalea sp. TaxID=3100273 RepID=UPI00359363BA
MTSDKLYGLVLSGGESRRMGRDKGLISTDSIAWVNRAGKLLQYVDMPVAVMIREEQKSTYSAEVFSEFELIADHALPVGGPLKGLLSFHRLYPQSDVLVLPCDMPNMSADVLKELIDFYLKNPDYEAWVFENQKVLQPFPGIFSAQLLAAVLVKIENGCLSGHGLTRLLNSSNTAHLVLTDESSFQNFNTPHDF